MKEEILVPCECGCGIVVIGKLFDDNDEDDAYFMSHYYSSFYQNQNSIKDEILTRIKMIWFIMIGKRYCLYETILNKKNVVKLRNFMNNIDFNINLKD